MADPLLSDEDVTEILRRYSEHLGRDMPSKIGEVSLKQDGKFAPAIYRDLGLVEERRYRVVEPNENVRPIVEQYLCERSQPPRLKLPRLPIVVKDDD